MVILDIQTFAMFSLCDTGIDVSSSSFFHKECASRSIFVQELFSVFLMYIWHNYEI